MDTGTSVGSLYYDLNIDDKKLKSQLDEADKSVKSFGDKVSQHWEDSVNASKKFMVGIAAVGAAAIGFGVASVKAYSESQTALTQLDAVLKSTGGTAGVTHDAAVKLSKEIQNTTSVSDEAALAVENMGLTFTAIHSDIFPKATMAAIDMATALNHGMKPSAEQSADAMKLLGKALQDPDAGLGALHRVGVNVEELKKKFEGVSDVATKQKLILEELGTEFGGSAAAQAKTFAGRIDQLKNAFNDLQEGVGEVIVKALGPVADWFSRIVKHISDAGGMLKMLEDIWKTHKDTIMLVFGAIAGALVPAIVAMGFAFGGFLLILAPWALIGAATAAIFSDLHISVSDVKDALKEATDKVIGIATQIGDYLWPKLKDLWGTISNDLLPVLEKFWHQYLEPIINVLGPAAGIGLVWALGFVIDTADFLIKNILTPLIGWFDKNKTAVEILTGAFVVLKVQMMLGAAFDAIKVAFVVFQTVQVPSMMATLGSLGAAFWAAFPLAAIAAAAIIAFEKIQDAGKKTIAVMTQTQTAIVQASNSDDAAAQRLKDAYKAGTISKDAYIKGTNEIYLGHNAGGTDNWGGGLTWVGERGPEIVNLPKGSQVIPNHETKNFMNKGGTTVNIGVVEDRQDADYILRRLDNDQLLESKGLSPVIL